MRRQVFYVVVCLLFSLFFSACQATSEEPNQLTIDNPDPGKGGIHGVVEIPARWKDQAVIAYLASFYGDENNGGNFILEPNRFPKAQVNKSGEFVLNNLEPGKYVLVIGPEPEVSKLVMKEGMTLVFEVKSDQILELSDIYLSE